MTVTPQQEISKTLNSSKNSLKILNIYFWEIMFAFGEITCTFGEIRFTLGGSRRFLGFVEFNSCCFGGFGTLWGAL